MAMQETGSTTPPPAEKARRWDYEKDPKAIVTLTKDEVVKWVNNLGNSSQEVIARDPNFTESNKAKEAREEGFPLDDIIKLSDREERKALLGRLGITADTPDSYRLTFYNDDHQHVIFKGTLDEKSGKLTLSDRMVLGANVIDLEHAHGTVFQYTPENLQDKQRVRELRSASEKIAGESIGKFLSSPLTPLPEGRTIEVSAGKRERIEFPDSNDTREGMRPKEMEKLNISPEELKKLETKVTLIALADKALNPDVKFASEHNIMPRKGPASEVGLA